MNGIRFYQDENGCGIKMRGWKKSFPKGYNGLAIFPETFRVGTTSQGKPQACVETISAVYSGAGDGPYCGSSASVDYIQEHCRRIGEAEARKLFPELVKRLES